MFVGGRVMGIGVKQVHLGCGEVEAFGQLGFG